MIFNFISDRRPLCSESEIARRTRCNFGHLSTVVIPTVKGIAELLQIFKSNGFTLDSIRRYVIVGCTFSILVENGIRDRCPLCSESEITRRTCCNVGHFSTIVIPTIKGVMGLSYSYEGNCFTFNRISSYVLIIHALNILISNSINDRHIFRIYSNITCGKLIISPLTSIPIMYGNGRFFNRFGFYCKCNLFNGIISVFESRRVFNEFPASIKIKVSRGSNSNFINFILAS